MKVKILVIAGLLFSATTFAQHGKKPAGPHPVVNDNHGAVVSDVAQRTHDGKTVSAVASSKNNGHHYGQLKAKKHPKRTAGLKKGNPKKPVLRGHR